MCGLRIQIWENQWRSECTKLTVFLKGSVCTLFPSHGLSVVVHVAGCQYCWVLTLRRLPTTCYRIEKQTLISAVLIKLRSLMSGKKNRAQYARHNVENCSRRISKELTIINRSHHAWFKNSDIYNEKINGGQSVWSWRFLIHSIETLVIKRMTIRLVVMK